MAATSPSWAIPPTSGNGSSFNISGGMAISASCKNPEAAWSFVRTILTEDYQTTNYFWQFPTNKHSFEAYKEQAMKQEYYEDPENRRAGAPAHHDV